LRPRVNGGATKKLHNQVRSKLSLWAIGHGKE
jgi:hypothetical protein